MVFLHLYLSLFFLAETFMDILREINEHVFALDLKVVEGIFFSVRHLFSPVFNGPILPEENLDLREKFNHL